MNPYQSPQSMEIKPFPWGTAMYWCWLTWGILSIVWEASTFGIAMIGYGRKHHEVALLALAPALAWAIPSMLYVFAMIWRLSRE